MNESDALLILNAISGLGSIRIRKLMEKYGPASEILSLKRENFLTEKLIPLDVVENILQFPQQAFLEKEYAFLKKNDACFISLKDPFYPKKLLEIIDFPIILYVKGNCEKFKSLNLAIVGSRQASLYGTTMAAKFAEQLSELGLTIVSGMARGIDTYAHQGALKAGGSTIAVLGCGLNYIYPPENKELMEKITKQGAVISEFPMDVAPIAHNFPRRNRIISGLSLGVLVIEAALKSGALITADCALEQGREVFALPGKVDNLQSEGVHNLIKQGAKLVTRVEDILEELKNPMEEFLGGATIPRMESVELSVPETNLPEHEQLIYSYLNDRPIHMDELKERCGLVISSLGSLLFKLELKKLIKQLPGKMFVRSK